MFSMLNDSFQSALADAFINIRIPVLLGDLVNVISSSSRDELKNVLEEIKKPAIKLIQYYSLQVKYILHGLYLIMTLYSEYSCMNSFHTDIFFIKVHTCEYTLSYRD